MTSHPYHRTRSAVLDDLDPVLVRTLEQVADGLPIPRTPLRRLVSRRLVHRYAGSEIDRPTVADLTPRGQAALAMVYARRSRLELALLEADQRGQVERPIGLRRCNAAAGKLAVSP